HLHCFHFGHLFVSVFSQICSSRIHVYFIDTSVTGQPVEFIDSCVHPGNLLPNIGRPLLDDSRVTSSSITSQCSARTPSSMRTMSAVIQFAGWAWPEKRPCTITKSPSATIIPDSYFRAGGMLLMRLNRPSRP